MRLIQYEIIPTRRNNMTIPILRRLSVFTIVAVFLLTISGCASKSTTADAGGDSGPIPSAVNNYDDIEIPPEMKMDTKKSMSIKTESFRGGVLNFKGKIEITSLRDYMIASMTNNKWRHVGEASYDNVLLAFTKPNKTCMITLEEGFGGNLGSTYMELYITVDVAADKKLNPFGEPVGN